MESTKVDTCHLNGYERYPSKNVDMGRVDQDGFISPKIFFGRELKIQISQCYSQAMLDSDAPNDRPYISRKQDPERSHVGLGNGQSAFALLW